MSFKKLDKIGTGAYSKIYRVEDDEGEQHAVKICLKEYGFSFGVSYHEADVALRFSHPYIICLKRTLQGNPFSGTTRLTSPLDSDHAYMSHDLNHLLYELADVSFHSYLDRNRITVSQMISVLAEILLGLEHMHLSGYVHRDFRPDNVLMFYDACESCENCRQERPCSNPGLRAKISDFGFTRFFLRNDRLTYAVNNTSYRAPECLQRRNNYNYNVDVWSFGCMLYFIVQGKMFVENFMEKDVDVLEYLHKERAFLFSSGDSFEDFFPLTDDFREELNAVTSEVHLQALVEGCLQSDPNKRLSTTECLNLPFFDSVRTKITNTRESFPPFEKEDPILSVPDCLERTWSMESFKALYESREQEGTCDWYSSRVFFMALTLVDEALTFLKRDENPHIIPNDNMGKILTKRQFNIIYIVCLYFSVKYLTGATSKVISFHDVYPKIKYTEEEYIYASNFEIKLFTEILDQKVFRPTLFDRLLDERPATDDDVRSLFVFYINGHYDGRTLSRSYAMWMRSYDRYLSCMK